MILVEDLSAFLMSMVPLEALFQAMRDPFNVGSDHSALRGGRLDLGKPFDLLFNLSFTFGVSLASSAGSARFRFHLDGFVLTQLFLNGAHLLLQVVFPLGLVDLASDLYIDILLYGQDLDSLFNSR